MSNKRFTITKTQIGKLIHDNQTGLNTGDICILCDLLNEQQNTIDTYHSGNKLMKRTIDRLKDENEQLKKQLESVTQLMGKADWKGVMDTLNGLIR